MRDAVLPGVGHLRRRRVIGSIALMGVGLLALFFGLFGGIDSTSAAASLLGLGAVLMMFGVAFLAPLLVQPLARVLGAPMAGNLPGKLARENAIRQPQRTAVTAAALMVGLALVVLVTVFAAGIRGSVTKVIDDQVSGRADRPEPGRLLADPAAGGRRRRARRRRQGRLAGALLDRHLRRLQPGRDRHRAVDDQLGAQAQVGQGRRADPRRPDRLPGPARRQLGQVAQRRRGRVGEVHDARGQDPDLRGRGHVQEPGRPDRPDHPHRGNARVPVGLQEPRVRDGRGRRGRGPGQARRVGRPGAEGPSRRPTR